MSEQTYAAFDADGRRSDDDATTVRVTVTNAGVVRSAVNYLDDDSKPVPMEHATRAITTIYDAEGSVVSSYDALDDD